jgi:hypothetical protein
MTINPVTGLRTVRNTFVNVAIQSLPDFMLTRPDILSVLDLVPDPAGHYPWQLPPGLPPERQALQVVTDIVDQQALQNRKVLNKEHTKFL